MSTSITDTLEKEVDGLVLMGEKLSRDASRAEDNLGPDRVEELGIIASRSGQLIRRLYGPSSHYEEHLKRVIQNKYFTSLHSGNYEHVSELVGIVKGVQRDIQSGLLRDIRRLLQAEVFADFLDMAEHLLNEQYKDAAAVLIGATLEDSLRKLAASRSVSVTNATSGRPLTIDPLNVALARDGAYNPLVQKQITSWANLRNDAAHGNFAAYDEQQVRHMLLFTQKFCGDYLQ
ncbi:MAG: hypothetical protein M3P06_13860 [Acidobacteriota bacterium]|nr:hypothetical protein [Acidobacteriota bacterium]